MHINGIKERGIQFGNIVSVYVQILVKKLYR